MANRSVGVQMLEPVRPEAVLPDRALCLPTFSHFLIVNKLLSLPSGRDLRRRLPPLLLLPVALLLSSVSIDTGAHDPDTHNHPFCAQVQTEEEEEEQTQTAI